MAWASLDGAPVLAHLMAAHVESEGHQEFWKTQWKVEAPALETQMKWRSGAAPMRHAQ